MRLRTRIVGATAVVIVVVTTAFIGYLLRSEREASAGRLRLIVKETEHVLAAVAVGPLYDGNLEQLNAILDSVFTNDYIVRMTLTESGGSIALSRTRAPQAAGATFTNRVPLRRGSDLLGEIEITYSTGLAEQALRQSRNRILLYSGLLLLVISGVVYATVAGVSRPIQRLAAVAGEMAEGRLDREIDARGSEEVESLGRSFSRMRDAVRERIAELAARNDALLKSEWRLQAAIDVARIGIFDHDRASDAVYWSAQQREIYGVGPDEPVTVQMFLDRTHPDDIAGVVEKIRQAHDPSWDGVWDAEHRIVRRDGAVRWVRQRSQTFFEGTGPERSAVRTVGAVLDITERREAEEEQQKLVRILEASADFVGIADLEGRLLYVNPAGLRLVGLESIEAVRSTKIGDFLSEDHVTFLMGELMPSIMRTGGWTGELALRNFRTGDLIPVDMNAFMIRAQGSGRPIALANISRDITERKRVQAERERLIGELELRNAELERFTYTVSHDLRSPLITIRGFLGYLEKDIQSGNLERVPADLGRISDAADRMDRLLRELLELSRIGRVANPPEEVPFETIATEAVELVSGQLQDRRIRVDVAQGMPVVHGDRLRLVEVVQNLVDNAAKFMGDQPRPVIEIGVRERQNGGLAVFYVRDNGVGIEPQYHDRVFGLFNKLDPATEGTGIGLALVRRIVEFHGGTIWIESPGRGAGSTFCFTLPSPGAHAAAPATGDHA